MLLPLYASYLKLFFEEFQTVKENKFPYSQEWDTTMGKLYNIYVRVMIPCVCYCNIIIMLVDYFIKKYLYPY